MFSFKKISPVAKGLVSIILVALILLYTDRQNRNPQTEVSKEIYQGEIVPVLTGGAINPQFKTNVKDGLRRGWPDQKMRLALIEYSDTPFTEYTEEGIRDGLKEIGLVQDKDFLLEVMNAQGDITMLNSIMDVVATKPFDYVMTTSTPTLQAACRKLTHKTVIFTTVADPVVAGAGKDFTDHRPNMTGISTLSDFEGMMRLVKALIPGADKVGTLYNPSEVNAVVNKESFDRLLAANGITLVSVPVNSTSEIGNALESLIAMQIRAICQVVDNTTGSAFPQIIRICEDHRLPCFTFDSPQIQNGATAAVARDYYQAGIEGVYMLARVIAGEDPARIPFQYVSKTDILINEKAAIKCGITIPEEYRSFITGK
ncbi:MAG TPA: ABC transporter substrate-binding protein [Bacteroidales bacterium]|nr:ABC transporter substrate-binding protein [Bacteroidales bacterium]